MIRDRRRRPSRRRAESDPGGSQPRATYGEAFAVAEFRALWLAQLTSVAGDQLARVALTVLVFDQTGSAGWSAVTYALTFLPDLVGGPLLSGLADRYPRRRVMVICDLLRAILVAAMAIPGLPLWLVGSLLFAVQLCSAPFSAARAALLPTILTGDRYVAGSSISNITAQLAQLVGFAAGGTIVAGVGVGNALLVDAATFAVAAGLIWRGVREHQVPAPDATSRPGWWESLTVGSVLVWRDTRLRYLIALACVSGFYVTVEGLAVPYAAELGGGPIEAGLLFAANPAGQVVGMLLLTRQRPDVRIRLIGPLAIASCLPLVFCGFGPGLTVTLALWVASGIAAAYQLPANTTFVLGTPEAQRGQAFGLARTLLIVSQGGGVLLAGVAADRWSPSVVVAAAGAVGILVAAAAAAGLARALQHHGGYRHETS